jgi:hypothetical protein
MLLALIVLTTSALAAPRPVTVPSDAPRAQAQTVMKQFGLGLGGCAVIAGSAALRLRRRRAL